MVSANSRLTDTTDTSDSGDEIDPRTGQRNNFNLDQYRDRPGPGDAGSLVPSCPVPHSVGKEFVSSVLPGDIDTIFTMLFTGSKFFMDLHASRKNFDIVLCDWALSEDGSQNVRKVSMTVALNHPLGPKHSYLTESQVMLPVSKPGRMYAVDAETVNAGIPYADSFYVTTHYCLSRITPSRTKFCIVNQIKYKKSMWGLAKGIIEKNTWAGLEEFYTSLERALQEECKNLNLMRDESLHNSVSVGSSRSPRSIRSMSMSTPTGLPEPLTLSSRTRRKGLAPEPPRGGGGGGHRHSSVTFQSSSTTDRTTTGTNGMGSTSTIARSHGISNLSLSEDDPHPHPAAQSSAVLKTIVAILASLLLLNAFLYAKLTDFDAGASLLLSESQAIEFRKNVPRDQEEWTALLKQQEHLHRRELRKWQQKLDSVLTTLNEVDEDLESIRTHIAAYEKEKIAIESLQDAAQVAEKSGSGSSFSNQNKNQRQQQVP